MHRVTCDLSEPYDDRCARRDVEWSISWKEAPAAAGDGNMVGLPNSYSWDAQRAVSRANVYITKKLHYKVTF